MECKEAKCIEEINSNTTIKENTTKITDNRIILSILFGISGIIFFVLFLDSHYKNMKAASSSILDDASLGKELKKFNFGRLLKNK